MHAATATATLAPVSTAPARCEAGRHVADSRRFAGPVTKIVALPLILFLVFGVVELGRYIWVAGAVAEAAAEGARMALLHGPTDAEVADAVESTLLDRGLDTDHSVTIGPRESSQPVTVHVEASVDLMVLDALLGDAARPTRVASTSVMHHDEP